MSVSPDCLRCDFPGLGVFESFTVIVLTTGFGDGKNLVFTGLVFIGLFSFATAFDGLNFTGLICFAGLNLEGAIRFMKSDVASSVTAALAGDLLFAYSNVLGGFVGCAGSAVDGAFGGCQIFFGFSSCLQKNYNIYSSIQTTFLLPPKFIEQLQSRKINKTVLQNT